jgi:hypothetical protein
MATRANLAARLARVPVAQWTEQPPSKRAVARRAPPRRMGTDRALVRRSVLARRMPDEAILARMDELIPLGYELASTRTTGMGAYPNGFHAGSSGWRARASTCVIDIAGSTSPYSIRFEQDTVVSKPFSAGRGAAILEGLGRCRRGIPAPTGLPHCRRLNRTSVPMPSRCSDGTQLDSATSTSDSWQRPWNTSGPSRHPSREGSRHGPPWGPRVSRSRWNA